MDETTEDEVTAVNLKATAHTLLLEERKVKALEQLARVSGVIPFTLGAMIGCMILISGVALSYFI